MEWRPEQRALGPVHGKTFPQMGREKIILFTTMQSKHRRTLYLRL
jgi:hypothetical protein